MSILEKLKNKEIQMKFMNRFLIFGYLPLGILFGIFTPDNILDYSWARSFTEFMAGVIPWVADVGRHTLVPATQFIAAVMNVVAILTGFGLVFMVRGYEEEDVKNFRNLKKRDKIFITLLHFIMFFLAIYAFFLIPMGDPPRRKEAIIIGSKIGMGVYGSIVTACWILIGIFWRFANLLVAFLLEACLKKK